MAIIGHLKSFHVNFVNVAKMYPKNMTIRLSSKLLIAKLFSVWQDTFRQGSSLS